MIRQILKKFLASLLAINTLMVNTLSSYSNYSFSPKPFNLDFLYLDNVGMVNDFNAVRIDFNTGEKQVTDIQLIAKESGSNNL
jgi:hypothetical protein